MKTSPIALALHGGAGARQDVDYSVAEDHLLDLARQGRDRLERGESALDVVEELVVAMEDSGFYIAGKGAPPNKAGYVELDASIMVGACGAEQRKAGSLAAVHQLKNPVCGARAVMEKTPHVMLAGQGAKNFCREQNFAFIDNPEDYYVVPIGVSPDELYRDEIGHGTVGAVALDQSGRLAAATSTGGVFGKREGRVGDTPLIGSGTWADEHVAASCTGLGEYFILAGGAQDLASRVQYNKSDLQSAADALIADVDRLGGDGGVIAISRSGEIAFSFNSTGMKRAGFGVNQDLFAKTF